MNNLPNYRATSFSLIPKLPTPPPPPHPNERRRSTSSAHHGRKEEAPRSQVFLQCFSTLSKKKKKNHPPPSVHPSLRSSNERTKRTCITPERFRFRSESAPFELFIDLLYYVHYILRSLFILLSFLLFFFLLLGPLPTTSRRAGDRPVFSPQKGFNNGGKTHHTHRERENDRQVRIVKYS